MLVPSEAQDNWEQRSSKKLKALYQFLIVLLTPVKGLASPGLL